MEATRVAFQKPANCRCRPNSKTLCPACSQAIFDTLGTVEQRAAMIRANERRHAAEVRRLQAAGIVA